MIMNKPNFKLEFFYKESKWYSIDFLEVFGSKLIGEVGVEYSNTLGMIGLPWNGLKNQEDLI